MKILAILVIALTVGTETATACTDIAALEQFDQISQSGAPGAACDWRCAFRDAAAHEKAAAIWDMVQACRIG